MHVCNVRLSLPRSAKKLAYGAVVLHPSLLDMRFEKPFWGKLQRVLSPLKEMGGERFALANRSHLATHALEQFCKDFGFKLHELPSAFISDASRMYFERDPVPHAARTTALAWQNPPVDYWQGPSLSFAQGRVLLGAEKWGAWQQSRVLFCRSARTQICDPFDQLRPTIDDFQRRFPEAEFETISAHCFGAYGRTRSSDGISSFLLTAILSKTCLLLLEGSAPSFLRAGEDFISLSRDLRNIEEVRGQIADVAHCEQLAHSAYERLIASPLYSERAFVHQLFSQLPPEDPPRSFLSWRVGKQLHLRERWNPRGETWRTRIPLSWKKKYDQLRLAFTPKEVPTKSVSCKNIRCDLAIAAIYQNEAPYLQEWIDYHQQIGVEHFLLYNNLSSDDHRTVLQPYVEAGVVQIIEWPSPFYPKCQLSAYGDAIRRTRGRVRWLAIVDIDEFLVPHGSSNLLEFLSSYTDYAGVAVNWQIFGHSGLSCLPEGALLTSHLRYKFPPYFHIPSLSNQYVKSIVCPERVSAHCTSSHVFTPLHGYVLVDADKHPLESLESGMNPRIPLDKIQCNHYWFRTREWFEKEKIARRSHVGDLYEKESLEELSHLANQHEDVAIQRLWRRE